MKETTENALTGCLTLFVIFAFSGAGFAVGFFIVKSWFE